MSRWKQITVPLPLFAKIETISAAATAALSLSVELKLVGSVSISAYSLDNSRRLCQQRSYSWPPSIVPDPLPASIAAMSDAAAVPNLQRRVEVCPSCDITARSNCRNIGRSASKRCRAGNSHCTVTIVRQNRNNIGPAATASLSLSVELKFVPVVTSLLNDNCRNIGRSASKRCRAGNSHCTATIVRQNRNNIGSRHHNVITQRQLKFVPVVTSLLEATAATLAAVPVNDVALDHSHCTATIVRQNRNNIGSCHCVAATITQRRIEVCPSCDITARTNCRNV